jgi:integrative and conjugative element protein (TIGR02256 family)
MPTALVDFETEYGDDVVAIVADEWVCPDHELVRRFPGRFVADPPQRLARGRRRPARTWERMSRSPLRSRTSGLPKVTSLCRYDVRVVARAWRAIDSEIADGLESGGVLIGSRADDGSFVVSDASGPAADSLRTSNMIRHDTRYYARWAEARAHTGDIPLGIWHEHPNGSLEPSTVDLRSWQAAAELSRGGTFLGVIVATDPTTLDVDVRAWTVTDTTCDPVNLQIERT